MLHELATAGPVFWIIIGIIVFGVVGRVSEKMRRRKLEISLQAHLDRKTV